MLAKPHYKDFTFMKGQLHTSVLLGIRQNREVHKLVMGRAGAIVPADSFKGDAPVVASPPPHGSLSRRTFRLREELVTSVQAALSAPGYGQSARVVLMRVDAEALYKLLRPFEPAAEKRKSTTKRRRASLDGRQISKRTTYSSAVELVYDTEEALGVAWFSCAGADQLWLTTYAYIYPTRLTAQKKGVVPNKALNIELHVRIATPFVAD